MAQLTEAVIKMFKERVNAGIHINSTCNEEAQLPFAWEQKQQLEAENARLRKELAAVIDEAVKENGK
jgi:hypothetical protein